MKLQKFDGGLSTRLRPQYLALNEAVEYINIDNSTGALTPVRDKINSGLTGLAFNWYSSAVNKWFSKDIHTSYAELGNKVYEMDGITIPRVHDSSASYSMGLNIPDLTGTTITAVEPATPVTDVTLESVPSLSPDALPYQDLTYLLVNDNNGFYSLAFQTTISAANAPKTTTLLGGRFGYTSVGGKLITSAKANKNYVAANNATKRTIIISAPRTEIFGSNGVRVFRQYKGIWRRVGVLDNPAASIIDHSEDISASQELDISLHSKLQGIYQYVVTFYDKTRGRESGPTLPTVEFDLNESGQVNFVDLPISSDPTVTHKRIYRVGGELTTFSLVAELPNSQTIFEDTVPDLDIIDALTTQNYLPAAIGFNYVTTLNGMLFAAAGANLRYTPIGQPEAWPELYFITFEATITSIAAVFTGILVCTATKTYIVTGSGPNSLAMFCISNDQGCIAHSSMQVLKGSALWVSQEGICSSSGDVVSVISRDKLGVMNLNPRDSILVNEVYYVLDNSGIAYCLDTAIGPMFKKFNLGITSFAKKGSDVYGYNAGILYILFKAATNLAMTYKSPRFIEGSFTSSKLYKHIYIYSKGDIIIKLFINDTLVTTKQLTTEDNHTVYAPQKDLRGFFIQFEITGTGEVFEIEYAIGNP